jgi:hypothetical protein
MRGIIVKVVLAEIDPATALTMCGPFGPAGTLNEAVPAPAVDEVNFVTTRSSNLIQTVTLAGNPATVTLTIVSTRPCVGDIVMAGAAAPEKAGLAVGVGGTEVGVFVEVEVGAKVAVSVGAMVAVGGISVAVGSAMTA